jgi:hypothetical protein
MGSNSSSGGGGSTVITGVQPPQKPLNLLNAVGEIQQWGSIESKMDTDNQLGKNYFTTQNRLDFFTIGIKNSLTHLFFTLLFTPLAVGVIDNLIHLFGDKQLTAFDRIYAIFLSFSVSIGFSVFLISLKNSYAGTVSKAMINNLFAGIGFGEFLKIMISFIIYQILYIQMSPEHIAKFLLFAHKYFGSILFKVHLNYVNAFNWLVNFREVFPLSELLIILSSIVLIVPPVIAIFLYGRNKNKRNKDWL